MSMLNQALPDSKAFRTAAADFALAGAELHATVGLDGVTRLHAMDRGRVDLLDDLEQAGVYLAQIGGAP